MNPPSCIVFLDRGTLLVAMRVPALPLQWQEHDATPPEQVVERMAWEIALNIEAFYAGESRNRIV